MRYTVFFILLLFFTGCDKPVYEKPANLIPRKKMIDMLVDVHMAEATFQTTRYIGEKVSKLKTADYYYAVLRKYNVPDTVFEKSLVYYASMPKEFDKMYLKVLDKMHLLEQQYIEPENKPVNVGAQ